MQVPMALKNSEIQAPGLFFKINIMKTMNHLLITIMAFNEQLKADKVTAENLKTPKIKKYKPIKK